MEPEKIIDLVGVKKIGQNKYESRSNPSSMGNARKIAYGGCALSNIVHAAYSSLPNPKYHLYSLLGQYLGPTTIDRKVICYVYPYRETRTFYTCRIEAKQIQDNGQERSVMMAIADFQVSEPSMPSMIYSAPPTSQKPYTHHTNLPTYSDRLDQLVSTGKVPDNLAKLNAKTFGLMARFISHKPCPEGISAQNLSGMLKTAKTTQENLPLTSKTSADWFQIKNPESATSPAEHLAAMAFIMDAALSFIPLTHSHMFFDDVDACSSLDFALRFFRNGNEIDLGKDWFLREMRTVVGAEGRTYSEGVMWDDMGRMVGSMTQQSIMRVKPAVVVEKKKKREGKL